MPDKDGGWRKIAAPKHLNAWSDWPYLNDHLRLSLCHPSATSFRPFGDLLHATIIISMLAFPFHSKLNQGFKYSREPQNKISAPLKLPTRKSLTPLTHLW